MSKHQLAGRRLHPAQSLKRTSLSLAIQGGIAWHNQQWQQQRMEAMIQERMAEIQAQLSAQDQQDPDMAAVLEPLAMVESLVEMSNQLAVPPSMEEPLEVLPFEENVAVVEAQFDTSEPTFDESVPVLDQSSILEDPLVASPAAQELLALAQGEEPVADYETHSTSRVIAEPTSPPEGTRYRFTDGNGHMRELRNGVWVRLTPEEVAAVEAEQNAQSHARALEEDQ